MMDDYDRFNGSFEEMVDSLKNDLSSIRQNNSELEKLVKTPQQMAKIAELTTNNFYITNIGWTDNQLISILEAYELTLPFIQGLDGYDLAANAMIQDQWRYRNIAQMRGLI